MPSFHGGWGIGVLIGDIFAPPVSISVGSRKSIGALSARSVRGLFSGVRPDTPIFPSIFRSVKWVIQMRFLSCLGIRRMAKGYFACLLDYRNSCFGKDQVGHPRYRALGLLQHCVGVSAVLYTNVGAIACTRKVSYVCPAGRPNCFRDLLGGLPQCLFF